MMIQFMDVAPAKLAGTRKVKDGYLVTEAFSARTGVQLYRGKEVGLDDMEVVRVYRPEEEVRSPESLRSFSHAPITIGHPKTSVTDANWKELAVGEVSTEATWQDNKIKLPLIIKDRAAIALVERGTRELSPGYTAEIVLEDGISPEGEPYDAVQRNIRINHLAIVKRGRSGEEVRIGDGSDDGHSGQDWGVAPIHNAVSKEDNMQKVLVDGLTVETTEAGAQAIAKLQQQLADAKAEAVEQKKKSDEDLAKAESERDELKKKQIGDADMDALVQERADLVTRAKAVFGDVQTVGVNDADLRRTVVARKLGDAAVAGKSDAYVAVRFDDIADAVLNRKPDPVRKALGDNATTTVNDGQGGWDHALKSLGIN